EREKISLSLATIRLLGNAVDQEALNEATRTLTPAVGAQSNPGSATTSSTSTSSPSADEKGKHVPPGDCPHTRGQCPLLKIRKCPWPPRSHEKDGADSKRQPPGKKQRH
ncbi:hypothetical protein FOZ63_031212, partial [Perkinsus olseni]